MMDRKDPPEPFLKRWSQRKVAAARETATPPPPAAVPPVAPAVAATPGPVANETAAEPALPALESLTFDSDFTAFMSPKVDAGVRQQALRKLFTDPRFNVMDGLDVYIDDYTKFEPVPPELIGQLAHAKFLFDPPKTRVNEQGYVEDVPAETLPIAEAPADLQQEAQAEAQVETAALPDATDDASLPPPAVPVAAPDKTR